MKGLRLLNQIAGDPGLDVLPGLCSNLVYEGLELVPGRFEHVSGDVVLGCSQPSDGLLDLLGGIPQLRDEGALNVRDSHLFLFDVAHDLVLLGLDFAQDVFGPRFDCDKEYDGCSKLKRLRLVVVRPRAAHGDCVRSVCGHLVESPLMREFSFSVRYHLVWIAKQRCRVVCYVNEERSFGKYAASADRNRNIVWIEVFFFVGSP